LIDGMRTAIAVTLLGLFSGCAGAPRIDAEGWIPLFDGRSLAGWTVTDFGSEGEVRVENGAIVLKPGNPFTGITFRGASFPKTDYEIELRGARVAGTDFFCALTLPVGDDHCTLVVGGWGGRLVGLSSLDDMDASENETTRFLDFENGREYDVRVRVRTARITAWIDDAKIVDQDVRGRSVSVRWEVEPSRPVGIASFETEAAFTRLRYRSLK
jgi:3-keto-disaccharide hydrolase